MSDKHKIKEMYDTTAEVYDSRYRDIQEEKYRIMLEDLQLEEPVLDLGSGTGMLQDFLKTKGIIGLDISYGMLKKSKEISVQGDAESLPFKDKTFNTVLSFTAAQNLDDTEKMLKEIARVLKPKGLAVVTILSKFTDKLKNAEKFFQILEIKTCGEDIGLVLSLL